MSLYYESAVFLDNDRSKGSLKSRVFSSKLPSRKSQPKQIFALVCETVKWSDILSEIIQNAGILESERKLTPPLTLLLVHDLLLTKRGITAPSAHPLRLAVERHKARLVAEFTRARLKRRCSTQAQLVSLVDATADAARIGNDWPRPRWVRINTLRTTLEVQRATTFEQFTQVESLVSLQKSNSNFYLDCTIENLIAINPSVNIANTDAYRKGEIILQDKASCFPASLLDPTNFKEHVIDACAAPGNKTTHLAALGSPGSGQNWLVHACERDTSRAKILKRMVQTAGAEKCVRIYSGQDFLNLNPSDAPWCDIGAILLDPSCSGSGIVGRDDFEIVTLPTMSESSTSKIDRGASRKRKSDFTEAETDTRKTTKADAQEPTNDLDTRLRSLSSFQLKMIQHAFQFPCVHKVIYSTCSIYAEEDEHVVARALEFGRKAGWHILKRQDQPKGLQAWNLRGRKEVMRGTQSTVASDTKELDIIADACIRCEKGTQEGTQGFFVAGFSRKLDGENIESQEQEEWNGFDV